MRTNYLKAITMAAFSDNNGTLLIIATAEPALTRKLSDVTPVRCYTRDCSRHY